MLTTLPRYQGVACRINGQRFYQFEQGLKLPSVTTILSATKNHNDQLKLEQWQEKIGFQQAHQIQQQSCHRGTIIHQWIEDYLLNQNLPNFTNFEQLKGYWNSIYPVLQQISQVQLIEGFVWHPLGFAGTLDCLGYYENNLCLIDWKTSSKFKRKEWVTDYFIQSSAYSGAVNFLYQNYGVQVLNILVVIALPHGKAQVYFKRMESVNYYWYLFQQRLIQFQKKNKTILS